MCNFALNTPLTILSCIRCKAVITLLKQEGFDMVPVIDMDRDIVWAMTKGNMTQMTISGREQPCVTVADTGVIYKMFRKLQRYMDLATLANALNIEPYSAWIAAAYGGIVALTLFCPLIFSRTTITVSYYLCQAVL